MKQRIVFVDYIRVVACLMVMLVHASENFYGADSSGLAGNMSMLANEQNRFWVAFWDGGVSRTAVPLFMIVSAFLLVPMPKGMTMTQFYRRRFKRILPPFVFFLLLYTFLPLAWGGMTWEQSMADLRLLPFNFPSMAGHLWFMFPLISLYLIMPVVSPWLEKATPREERIFIYIFAFTTLIPWLHRFVSKELWGECFWNEYHAFWYVSGYLGYLVLAHYIHRHVSWSRTKRIRIGAACFLVGAVFTAWSFWWKGTPGQLIETPMLEWSWEFCTPNVLLASFGLFVLFSSLTPSPSPKGEGSGYFPIGEHHTPLSLWRGAGGEASLAKLTFGMYLMHMFFLAPIATWIIGGDAAHPSLPVGLAIPAIALLTFICSAVTTKLLSLLPGSKYIVGC
ncbi:MAG: acyltransferase [Prevotella sp.]|nr:acyltransferase [Prevotella sp.]